MKKIFTFLLFCSIWVRLFADQAPYKIHELLLKTNLVAHVQLSASDNGFFRLKVLEVLHRKKSGITEGDYLKVKYDFNVVCPPTFPKEYALKKKKALAFLSYDKGQWHLTQGEIVFLQEDTAEFYFHEEGFIYRAALTDWKKSLSEYHQHFTLSQEGEVLIKNKTTDLPSKKYTSLTQLQYVSLGLREWSSLEDDPYLTNFDVVPPPEELEMEEQKQNRIYNYAASHPLTDSMQRQIRRDLLSQVDKNVPSLKESEIFGNNYYSLVFEKNGRISKVKLIRLIDPRIGNEIELYFSKHNQWGSALNEAGDKIRFEQKMILRVLP